MINTIEAVADLLQGTAYAGSSVIQLPIHGSTEVAFAIEVNSAQRMNAWQVMRDYLPQTKRWPVFVACWINTYQSWQQTVFDSDLFSRFYFEEEASEASPSEVIARAERVDLSAFMQARANFLTYDLDDDIDSLIAGMSATHGRAPTRSQLTDRVDAQQISNLIELEQWVFDWEQQNLNLPESYLPNLSYLESFEPTGQVTALILLPTANSWESLAYLNFFGGHSAAGIALLKKWQQQYQAELVCHYGTMLEFQVGIKPATPEAAFELACEQVALAPCTVQLPGISIREHARALMQIDRWFLHERP